MQPSVKDPPTIKVVVRKRPMSDREDKKNDIDIVEKKGDASIVVKERKYDSVYYWLQTLLNLNFLFYKSFV